MARNNLSELKSFRYWMADGIYDICAAHAARQKLGPKLCDGVGGIGAHYISRIESMHHRSTDIGKRHGQLIGEWQIIELYNFEADHAYVYAVRHLHLRTELSCATFRTAKREWWCCTCGEQVPLGILWAARTQAIRKATE